MHMTFKVLFLSHSRTVRYHNTPYLFRTNWSGAWKVGMATIACSRSAIRASVFPSHQGSHLSVSPSFCEKGHCMLPNHGILIPNWYFGQHSQRATLPKWFRRNLPSAEQINVRKPWSSQMLPSIRRQWNRVVQWLPQWNSMKFRILRISRVPYR